LFKGLKVKNMIDLGQNFKKKWSSGGLLQKANQSEMSWETWLDAREKSKLMIRRADRMKTSGHNKMIKSF
jgi:hypothetical protein